MGNEKAMRNGENEINAMREEGVNGMRGEGVNGMLRERIEWNGKS